MPAAFRPLLWLALALAVFAADWGSKALARAWLPQQNIEVIPWLLDLRLVFNRGIAFGMFADSPEWGRLFIVGLSVLLTAVGLYQAMRADVRIVARFGWVLFTGGALGNLWERLFVGQVTDFLALHLHTVPLFVFNLADAALSGAVFLLLLDEWVLKRRAVKA